MISFASSALGSFDIYRILKPFFIPPHNILLPRAIFPSPRSRYSPITSSTSRGPNRFWYASMVAFPGADSALVILYGLGAVRMGVQEQDRLIYSKAGLVGSASSAPAGTDPFPDTSAALARTGTDPAGSSCRRIHTRKSAAASAGGRGRQTGRQQVWPWGLAWTEAWTWIWPWQFFLQHCPVTPGSFSAGSAIHLCHFLHPPIING